MCTDRRYGGGVVSVIGGAVPALCQYTVCTSAEIIYQEGGRGKGGEGVTSYMHSDIQTLPQLDAFCFAEFAKYLSNSSS